MAIDKVTFTNADLVSNNFVYAHGLNTDVVPTWIDENDKYRNAPDLFDFTDSNNITVLCGTPITGTHTLILEYADAIITSGIRLFEKTTDTNPSTDFRIAMGKVGTATVNIPLSDFLTWFETNSAFMLNTLKYVNVAAAQGNLQVHSKSYIDGQLALKANVTYVDSEILANNAVSTLTVSATGRDSNLTSVNIFSYKSARLVITTATYVATAASPTTYQLLGTLPVFLNNNYHCAIVQQVTSNNECGECLAQSDGKIYVKSGKAGATYSFTISTFATT